MGGVLLPGGVFGSLPTQGEPEPFTVLATTPATEVLYVSGDVVAKLPRRLLDTVRDYLTRATTWRLENLLQDREVESQRMAREVAAQQAARGKNPTALKVKSPDLGAVTLLFTKYKPVLHPKDIVSDTQTSKVPCSSNGLGNSINSIAARGRPHSASSIGSPNNRRPLSAARSGMCEKGARQTASTGDFFAGSPSPHAAVVGMRPLALQEK